MTELLELQIKILRLNTGEDIVGSCLMDDEHGCVSIENPMKVFIKRASPPLGQTALYMMPWLPLEIIEDNLATINYDDIITVVDPKKSFVEYYNNAVEEYEAQRKAQEGEEEKEEEEIDDETMQDMLESLRESKRNRLH